jgi:hypothetical protein
MKAAMYRALTIVAVIYGMFVLGSKAINVIFQAGSAWAGEAATATVLFVGYAGVMVYRGLNMQPDIVENSHCLPSLRAKSDAEEAA